MKQLTKTLFGWLLSVSFGYVEIVKKNNQGRKIMADRTCAYCQERFDNIADHLGHVVTQHDKGKISNPDRQLKRPSHCWRCAKEIPNNQSTCQCGWNKQTKAKNEFHPTISRHWKSHEGS